MHVKTYRHRLFYGETSLFQLVRQIVRLQGQAHRVHTAADIHPHRSRNNRAKARYNRTYVRAYAGMYIRHGGHMTVDERQLRYLLELRICRSVDIVSINLDRNAAFVDQGLYRHEMYLKSIYVFGQPAGLNRYTTIFSFLN